MTEVERRKRPGVAFAGFVAASAVQVAVVAAYQGGYLTDAGWRGGEYAYAFIGIAVGSIVLGGVLKLLGPPWRSVGTGVLLAGAGGFAVVVTVFVSFLVALSQWGSG